MRPVVALTVIIAYDVSSDTRRAQVASKLQAWGERIQRSVFVCVLGPDELDRLCRRLVALIDTTHDTLHVIPVCADCRDGVAVFGQATFDPPPLHWFI